MDNEKLIKDHAPILWLHPREAFIPEDCKVMAERGDLYNKGKRVDSFNHKLESLGSFGKGHYLKLPDVDMREFTVPKGSGVVGVGPEAVAELARKRYGNNPFSEFTTRLAKPKFYVRVRDVNLKSNLPATPQNVPEILRMKPFLGRYTVIQYFFFYIFNDFWNKHVGDWDSTIEVLIKKSTREKFLFYSTHETMWFMKMEKNSATLHEWIKIWRKNKDGKKGINSVYSIKNHAFGFVSNGGHGVYPTPGYTMFGFPLPGIDDLIGATDERVIGHTCIVPEDVREEDIKVILKNSKPQIDHSNVKVLNWDKFELLGNQAWLNYGGLWGEDTKDLRGWDGPEAPTKRDKWKTDSDTIYKKIKIGMSGYKDLLTLKNRHEIS